MSEQNSAKSDAAHWALWLVGGVVLAGLGSAVGDGWGQALTGVGGVAVLVGLVGMVLVLVALSKRD